MRRFGSIAEAMEYYDESGNIRPAHQLPPDNALTDARQSMMHLVKNFGQGRKTFVLQDAASTEAICVRVRLQYGSKVPELTYLVDSRHSEVGQRHASCSFDLRLGVFVVSFSVYA